MYLVDTSVLIDYFRNKQNKAVDFFCNVIDKKYPFGITSVIYQEMLQGVQTEKDFTKLSSYLITQRFYHPADQLETYNQAAKIYFNCRKKGITVRSTIDCLIAQISIENDLTIIHSDKDYEYIRSVATLLKLWDMGEQT
jgi:predicted nucleic acid-binding protein